MLHKIIVKTEHPLESKNAEELLGIATIITFLCVCVCTHMRTRGLQKICGKSAVPFNSISTNILKPPNIYYPLTHKHM